MNSIYLVDITFAPMGRTHHLVFHEPYSVRRFIRETENYVRTPAFIEVREITSDGKIRHLTPSDLFPILDVINAKELSA